MKFRRVTVLHYSGTTYLKHIVFSGVQLKNFANLVNLHCFHVCYYVSFPLVVHYYNVSALPPTTTNWENSVMGSAISQSENITPLKIILSLNLRFVFCGIGKEQGSLFCHQREFHQDVQSYPYIVKNTVHAKVNSCWEEATDRLQKYILKGAGVI